MGPIRVICEICRLNLLLVDFHLLPFANYSYLSSGPVTCLLFIDLTGYYKFKRCSEVLMDRKVDHKNILFLLVAIFHIAALGMTTGCGDNKNMIQASSLTNGRVTLTWDSIPQFAAYEVYLSTTPGVSVQNAFRISDVSSPFTITDLQPGITYYFVVTAVDESGHANILRK